MRAREVFDLIVSGAIKPEAEVAVDVGFPPLKATLKFKAGDIHELMIDPKTVSEVVRRCYLQRRILHESLSDGSRDDCIASAREIVEELRSVQAGLSGAGRNAALVELLANWEDVSVEAQQRLQGSAQLIDILLAYRVKSLPTIEALIAMLPPDARTRRNAEEKIKETWAEIFQATEVGRPSPPWIKASSPPAAEKARIQNPEVDGSKRFVPGPWTRDAHEVFDFSGHQDFSGGHDYSKEPAAKNVAKELIARFGTAKEAPPREQVAALLNKGFRLGELGRREEAIAVYDDLLTRFGTDTEALTDAMIRERVARTLLNKGITLGQLGRRENAIAVYDDLLTRFGFDTEAPIRELVSLADLHKMHTLDDSERIEYFDNKEIERSRKLAKELIARFGVDSRTNK
jgi:tetratricopeptide (TPR) repeat protein